MLKPGNWTVEHRSWKLTKIANTNNGDGGSARADEKKAADHPLYDNEAANSYGGGGERRTAPRENDLMIERGKL